MKHFYNKLRRVMLTMVIALPFCAGAQLNVNSAATAQDLANAIVGSGVTVSNVVLSCDDNASGLFSNGNTTNVGISNGIILTTGRANDAIGPNNDENVTVNNSATYNGDADLDPLVSGSLNDVCALSFDFVATSDVITVQYVFSSEEYNEFVCSSFNDIFAFFVSGPNPLGGSYSNLNVALIPSTNLPVSINSVNNGTPGSQGSFGGCTSLDYSAYYVDNTGGTTIQYDGFTVVLTAQVLITPGESYHFKFAIADVSDSSLDSGVFIRGESFSIFNCQAGTISVNGSVEPILICSDDDIADTFSVVTNSTATGDTYVFLLVSVAGEILEISETGDFDLSSYSDASYFVYGLSYDGDVNGVDVGSYVNNISASDEDGCFDLSSLIIVYKYICTTFELISCAPDTTLECGSNLNDFSVTGVPVFEVYGGDGIVEISFTDTYLETSDCYSVISRTWTLSYGDITEICVQIITLVDTQGPVFPELENIYVQCLEEVPAPLALEAWDACSEASEVETF
ncbi:MAG: choice-of-anchor L domain-containing protein, partial [Flavobacteriales bacterium]